MNNQNSVVKFVVNKAIESKLKNLKKSNSKRHILYDALFFGKAKTQLGGNIKLFITGSAPISEKVLDFLKVVF